MKKLLMVIPLVILLCFVVSLCASTALAQAEGQKAQSYVVMEFVIKPGKIADFEASWKEGIDECKRQNYYLPVYAYLMDDFHFYAFYPMQLYSGIDDFFNAYADYAKKMGMEKLQKIHEREYASIEYYKMFLIRHRSDLSYTLESPRLKPEEKGFIFWDFYYIQPGMEKEFEELNKEWVALYKNNNIPDEYDFYVGDIGTEMPVYFYAESGKSNVDFWTQHRERWRLFGEEGDDLWERIIVLVRKREMKTGGYRADLSYKPKEK